MSFCQENRHAILCRLFLLCLVLAVAGCGRPRPAMPAGAAVTAERTLRIAIGSRPGPFDFAIAPSPEQTVVVRAAYETLIARTAHGSAERFVPGLAARWQSSSDGLTWDFDLEPGHRFDDGNEVDGEAVRYSLERLLRMARGSASELVDYIERVQVSGRLAVRIVLKSPTPLLLDFLSDRATSILNPRIERYARNGDGGSGWLGTHSAGSGPYRLVPAAVDGTWILERNPYANGPRPFFDQLMFFLITDPTVRALSIAHGTVDLAFMIPPSELDRLERDPQIRIESAPVLAFQNLALNGESPAFRSRAVRAAVAQAIDYDGIVRYIKKGRARRFPGPIPLGMAGASSDAFPWRYAPDRARDQARAAGVQPGTRVDLIYPGVSPETDTVAQYLQAALAPLGFQTRLERLSVPAYLDRIERGTYDAVLMGFVAEFDDPAAIVDYWFDSSQVGINNPARYRNAEVEALLHSARSTLDDSTRIEYMQSAIARANSDVPYVYLLQVVLGVALRRDIQGYTFNPVDTLLLPVTQLSRANERVISRDP